LLGNDLDWGIPIRVVKPNLYACVRSEWKQLITSHQNGWSFILHIHNSLNSFQKQTV